MEVVKFGKLLAAAVAASLVVGCSSGGGGHHHSSNSDQSSASPKGSGGSGGSEAPVSAATAGKASDQTYVAPDGTSYTLAGIPGTSMSSGSGRTLSYGSNGANGYARYGAWCSTNHTTTEYFYTGTGATLPEQVPTTGTATYAGKAIQANTTDGTTISGGSTSASFNVDFGAKTIAGQTEKTLAIDTVSMKGTIKGAGFSGSASSGSQQGNFSGHFYGPEASELAGTAIFKDATHNLAFGAVKQ